MTDLLWSPRPGPTRGPKAALTLARITAAAVEIADREGLAAVSMQRVADELGCGKMSLYRHVPGKTELVAVMVDTVVGAPPGPGTGDWAADLRTWATAIHAVFLRHRWLLDATTGSRPIGPRELDWTEAAVGALTGTGLTGAEQLDAVVTVMSLVRTIAQQTPPAGGPAGERSAEEQLGAVMAGHVARHPDRFPALSAAMASIAADGGQDDALGFGLARILDGLRVLVEARRGGA